jgi:predicted CopG family antitoxin
MASRNVSLKLEAYRALDAERRPEESFSDAVLRLTRGRPKLSAIIASFQPLDPKTLDEYGREVAKVRKEIERSMRRRLK